MLTPRHRVKKLLGRVLGVGGHEAQAKVAVNAVKPREKSGKVYLLRKPLAVRVHVLAQQGYFFIPGLHQSPALAVYIVRLAALLPAPHIGHDTVGAEVVAAVHGRDPGP